MFKLIYNIYVMQYIVDLLNNTGFLTLTNYTCIQIIIKLKHHMIIS